MHLGSAARCKHPVGSCARRVEHLYRLDGRYAGYDNGWVISLISPAIVEFDKSIVDFPNIKRFPGGASNDMNPDLQHPNNPVPLMDLKRTIFVIGSAD